MPNEQRPLKVFLSYASQDRPVVRELSRRLVGEGWIDPWLDEKNLLPGQDWRLKIEEAVEDSDVVIICLSSNSVSKEGYVQKELRYAREIALEKPDETIFLIPLRLDDCETPRGLRFYQWADYFGEKKDESYSALIESLKLRHEQKLKLEEVERARKEKQEREIAERVAREREEREVAEKLAREKATREKAENEATEKALLEAEEQAKQKAVKEKAEREVAEKIAREKAKQEILARQSARKATMAKALNNFIATLKSVLTQAKPFFRIGGVIGIIVILFWVGSLAMPQLLSLIPTAKPSATITSTVTPILPTKTLVPTPTKTKVLALTPTPMGGGSGKILYVHDNDIYSINSDSTYPIKLTNIKIVRQIVSVSPDASKIAFDSFSDLFIMNIDGTNIVKVAGKYFGVWLSDGRQIISEGGKDVFLASVDGTEYVELTPPRAYGENFDFIALSPDGTTVWLRSLVAGAYVRRPVYAMNIDGTNIINLTSTAGVDEFGAWSPDGKQVTYHSRSSAKAYGWNYDIFVMNSDGTEAANLTNGQGNNSFDAWSLDGNKILFSSNRNGQNDIFIMNKDGSDLINLTNGQGNNSFDAWSLDGSKMLFSSKRDGKDDIFVMNTDGSEQINLTADLAADWVYFCSWSPDGGKILLSHFSDPDSIPIFYTVNIDGTNLTRLADGNRYQADCPIWLP